MDIVALNKDIQNKNLGCLYIFIGPEIGLQNVYINQILKQRPGGHEESVESVMDRLKSTTSLFSHNTETTYIIRNDLEIMKNEKCWDLLEDITEGVTLILTFTDLNKKGKFYKKFKDYVVEFEKMTTQQLYKVVKSQLEGTKSAATYFIESCDNDYNTILNNIDKFKRCGFNKIDKFTTDIIIQRIEPGDIFKLLDYIIAKDNKNTLKELNNLLASGCSELSILSMIGNRLQQVIIIIGYADKPNIEEYTGFSKWICKNILKINKIHPNGLLQALRIVKHYDKYIKTGVLDPKVAVMSCVLKILCI